MSKPLAIMFTAAGILLLATAAMACAGIWTADQRWFDTAYLTGIPGVLLMIFGPIASLGFGD